MRYKLLQSVTRWPRAISPRSETVRAGCVVHLIEKASAVLFHVSLVDASTGLVTDDVFPVLASEVEEISA